MQLNNIYRNKINYIFFNRTTLKAATDYNEKEYPYTVNVIDLIRCSVTVETPKQLHDFIDAFYQTIGSKKGGCIKSLLRIKNGFNKLENTESIHYCDLKCNVFVEWGGMALVGEIQFLLNFMLCAKMYVKYVIEFYTVGI